MNNGKAFFFKFIPVSKRRSKIINIAYVSKAGADVVWFFLLFLFLIFIIVIVPALAARGRSTKGNTIVISWRTEEGE